MDDTWMDTHTFHSIVKLIRDSKLLLCLNLTSYFCHFRWVLYSLSQCNYSCHCHRGQTLLKQYSPDHLVPWLQLVKEKVTFVSCTGGMAWMHFWHEISLGISYSVKRFILKTQRELKEQSHQCSNPRENCGYLVSRLSQVTGSCYTLKKKEKWTGGGDCPHGRSCSAATVSILSSFACGVWLSDNLMSSAGLTNKLLREGVYDLLFNELCKLI